jgi:hypothetical protein
MSTSRGTPTIARRSAKNFIYAEAQKRLDEVLPQIHSQGINALRVDSHHVIYYSKSRGGHTCSCKIVDNKVDDIVQDDINTFSQLAKSRDTKELNEVKIDFNRPLFGERGEVATTEDDDTDVHDFLLNENPDASGNVDYQEHLFASNAECGICFRSGYVPGYNIHCHNRKVLTHYDIKDLDSFVLDRTQPHKFTSLNLENRAVFNLVVPKYWNSVKYSVRNNFEVLNCSVLINNQVLSKSSLNQFKGKQVEISVENLKLDTSFTHIVFDFELPMEQMIANISQLSKNLDYTMFDTTGSINVFFPMIHDRCESGDLIYVPEKKILLKVTDVTYSQTAKNVHLEWQCTTRVVQPQETLYKILQDTHLKL